jgi:hypothetical protein
MAVTTTPQQLAIAAYGHSLKNKAGNIANETSELLQVVIRSQRRWYALAARVNPTFFAGMGAVPFAAGGWRRPETAESVVRVEMPDGTRVNVTPHDDRTCELAPAVYHFGQVYRGVGRTGDPTAGNLTFFWSKRPTDPATFTAALDADWTEQFNQLIILDVAKYLATKDGGSGRAEEMAALQLEQKGWIEQYTAFLEHADGATVARFDHDFKLPSLVGK